MPLILASTSASRRALLANAGLAFEIEAPGVDEEEVKLSLLAAGADAGAIAERLAELKAVRVSARHPGALTIGADQTLACEGRLFDKPPTLADARDHLRALRGRTHELQSAVVVARDGARLWHARERARLAMHDFDDAFLDAYLTAAGEDITGSVGAYRLEGLGAQLFSRIEGDYFTILGLPLVPLLRFLALHGIGLGARP
ncbi:MAG: Maf-like protein [Alphaproteobacteria bacterium]|nr:Maf-like protein [Alphaproteobacteria bacterium]